MGGGGRGLTSGRTGRGVGRSTAVGGKAGAPFGAIPKSRHQDPVQLLRHLRQHKKQRPASFFRSSVCLFVLSRVSSRVFRSFLSCLFRSFRFLFAPFTRFLFSVDSIFFGGQCHLYSCKYNYHPCCLNISLDRAIQEAVVICFHVHLHTRPLYDILYNYVQFYSHSTPCEDLPTCVIVYVIIFNFNLCNCGMNYYSILLFN